MAPSLLELDDLPAQLTAQRRCNRKKQQRHVNAASRSKRRSAACTRAPLLRFEGEQLNAVGLAVVEMSQTNLEVVQASIDAYNAENLDAQMDTYVPDFVAVLARGDQALPDSSTTIVGREALRAWLQEERSAWRARYKCAELRPVGVDRVLSRGEWGGIGVTSGIEAYGKMSVLFTLRDGLISRAEFYPDHDDALHAAGLEN